MSSPSALASIEGTADEALEMTYPDQVIIPRNLEGLGFAWSDPTVSESTVYRLRFQQRLPISLCMLRIWNG